MAAADAGAEAAVQAWWFPRMVVQRVYLTLAAVCAVVLVLTAVPIALGDAGFTEETDYDWLIASGVPSKRMDALDSAQDQVDRGRRRLQAAGGASELRDAGNSHWSSRNKFYLTFETQDGSDILTPAHLQTICTVENLVLAHAPGAGDVSTFSYSDLCKLESYSGAGGVPCVGGECACARQRLSLAEVFYSGHSRPDGSRDCPLLTAAEVNASLPAALGQLYYIGREHDLSPSGFTSRTRSEFRLGEPAPGYSERPDDRKHPQQVDVYNVWWESVKSALFAHFNAESFTDMPTEQGGLTITYWAHVWGYSIFDDTVSADLNWAGGSIVFVLIVLCLHTGSFFLGGLGMLQILFSLPTALFFYRTLLQIEFVTQMHVLSIYLVLGIGADDLFVFFDAWVQSEHEPPRVSSTLLGRMDYTYKRAASAMLTTSFTTAVAFVTTATSPVMPISAFGVFAAFAVIMNYVLVMTVFPCLVYIWHVTGRRSCCCCNLLGCCGGSKSVEEVQRPTTPQPAEEGAVTQAKVAQDARVASLGAAAEGEEPQLRAIERFFVEKYGPFMRSKLRLVPLALFSGYFAFSVYYALQMDPPVSRELWFPDDHMLERWQATFVDFFGGDEVNYRNIDLVWGIDTVDRSQLNRWVPYNEGIGCGETGKPSPRGCAVWDEAFDPSSHAAQTFLASTCAQLRTRPCAALGCMDGSGNLVRKRGDGSVDMICFYEEWREWHSAINCSSADVGAASGPCTGLELDANTGAPVLPIASLPSGDAFVRSLATFRETDMGRWDERIGFVDGVLRFLTVRVKSTLEDEQSQTYTNSVHDAFDDLQAELNAAAPEGMSRGWHDGGYAWAWADTQSGLVNNVFNGFKICFPAAFLTLLLATHNFLLSLFAIITVAGIVACVLGFCKAFLGWGLGVAESIAAVIVIGFAVDFTVHLAHMYIESSHHSRADRMADAGRKMGVTVVMGAATTLGAGCFLWMCTLTFFTKFAILIIGTIGFSLAAALLFFMPLVATLGPEGDTCDVVALAKAAAGGAKREP